MADLKPTWDQVLNRAFWFSKFPDERRQLDSELLFRNERAPQEFALIMGVNWKAGHVLPPRSETEEATIVESLWVEAFLKLQKYRQRFGQFPPDALALDLFKDALSDISAYTES